jgi:ATP-binding cassette, subfamily F, member 3
LLDEPTNHLDLEMRHALTMALQEFEGAVIVVSHDRHLLRNTVNEFLLVANGSVSEFDGDLEDYYAWMQQQKNNATTAEKLTPSSSEGDSKVDKKTQRQQSAAQRAQLKPLTNKLKNLESQLEKLQKRLAEIETQLGDSSIYNDKNKVALQQLIGEQGKLQNQLEETEENWLMISEELEAANQA